MLTSILVCFLMAIGQVISLTGYCRKEDECMPVPADVCDRSKCIPFDLQEFNDFVKNGVRFYTYNLAPIDVTGYCVPKFSYNISKGYDGKLATTLTEVFASGQHCNVSRIKVLPYFGEMDDTGKLKYFTLTDGGMAYETCLLYYEPKVSCVYRKCRVDPPPPYGEGCALISAREAATGNCNRDKLDEFLKSLGMDFPQMRSYPECCDV